MLITLFEQFFFHVIIVVVYVTLPFLPDHKYPTKAMHSFLALTLLIWEKKSYLDHDNMSDFVQLNIYNQIYYNVTPYVRLVRKWPHDLFDFKVSKWDCTILSLMCILSMYIYCIRLVVILVLAAAAAVSMSVFCSLILDKWFGGRGSST